VLASHDDGWDDNGVDASGGFDDSSEDEGGVFAPGGSGTDDAPFFGPSGSGRSGGFDDSGWDD
jgi:hypothetical protein